jgi:hypothetical protein
MVRRPSIASRDSGTESTVYAKAPTAVTSRGDSAAKTPWNGSGERWAVWPLRLPAFFLAYASDGKGAPVRYLTPGAAVGGSGVAAGSASIEASYVPAGGEFPDSTVAVDRMSPGAAGFGAARLATTYDMLVIDPQSGRWYVKDIRASTQPMGTL